MSMDWYHRVDGVEYGPESAATLRDYAKSGLLSRTHDVRKGSTGDWVPASRVKGLFDRPGAGRPDDRPRPGGEGESPGSAPSPLVFEEGDPLALRIADRPRPASWKRRLAFGVTFAAVLTMLGVIVSWTEIRRVLEPNGFRVARLGEPNPDHPGGRANPNPLPPVPHYRPDAQDAKPASTPKMPSGSKATAPTPDDPDEGGGKGEDDKGPESAPAQEGPQPALEEAEVAAARRLLEGKGMTLVGTRFVLDEADALTKFDEANEAFAKTQPAIGRRNAIMGLDAEIATAKKSIANLSSRNAYLKTMQDDLWSANNGRVMDRWNSEHKNAHWDARNEMSANGLKVIEIQSHIRECEEALPSPQQRNEVNSECEQLWGAYVGGLKDLEYVMDPLSEKYRDLATNPEVRAALEGINRGLKKTYKVGPSDRFRTASRKFQAVQQELSPPRRGRR